MIRRMSSASSPGEGAENEDQVRTGNSWAVVVDGATALRGVDNGCEHGVAWFSERLAAALSSHITGCAPLVSVLRDSISDVCDAHRDCDLTNPESPSATLAMARLAAGRLEYAVLGDCSVVVHGSDAATLHITDARVKELDDYSVLGVRRARNTPGGFWVAAACPDAAEEAVTGTLEASDVDVVVLLTDGASRYVELLRIGDYGQMMRLVRANGPAALIAEVRAAEKMIDSAVVGRKRHDDASVAVIELRGQRPGR